MIKTIKGLIDKYVYGKLNFFYKKQRTINQIAYNYAQLNQLFADTSYYIPMTGWTMSPITITHVLNEIVVNDRKCIIEFGSGASSIYIAKLLKSNKIKASFFSIESDKTWADKIKKQLELLGLEAYVKIINAPIKSVENSYTLDDQQLWYDIDILNEHFQKVENIDLILVDGPFGSITPNSRFSAIPFLKNRMNDNYAVFLDDIHRAEEQLILKKWCKILNCSYKKTERYAILNSNETFFSQPFQL